MKHLSTGDALFTQTQQRVLALLFGKPDQSFYANEIVRIAAMGRGTVRRELERLVASGLLTQCRNGNQLHYQANAACPIYTEMLAIVRKTFGTADVVRESLEPLGAKLLYAFIFGSIAKGTFNSASDIDLLLIGKGLSYTAVVECLLEAETSLERKISPVIHTVNEIRSKLAEGNSFITRVLNQELIVLKGVKDDFGKPAAHQSTKGRGT